MEIYTVLNNVQNLQRMKAHLVIKSFNREFDKEPLLLYYPDNRILLQVYILEKMPTKADILKKKEYEKYILFDSGINKYTDCYTGCRKYMGVDSNGINYNIKSVFLVPFTKETNEEYHRSFRFSSKEDVVLYTIKHTSPQKKEIYFNQWNFNDNSYIEIDFIYDAYSYFKVNNIPKQYVAGNLMCKAYLRDACLGHLAPKEPGIYFLSYEGDIKKVGKTERTLFERLEEYYDDNKRKFYEYSTEACRHINKNNKDKIIVYWLEAPKHMCEELEKINDLKVMLLGHSREWSGRNAYSKLWLEVISEEYKKIKDKFLKILF